MPGKFREFIENPLRSQNFIRRLDIFGHNVNLNFDVFENKRKTMFGGVMTILMTMIILICLSIWVYMLFDQTEA